MNKYLILIKHSLPEIVEQIPAREWHLSEEGCARAERLAARLMHYQPEILFSSVEPKALETAEIIAKRFGLAVQVVEGLHEHDRSAAPFLSKDQFQKTVHEFFLNPDTLVFGNETANAAHSRFAKALDSLWQTHKAKTIVLISHGTVISLFVSHLTGVSAFSVWNELGLPSFIVLDMSSRTILAQENIL